MLIFPLPHGFIDWKAKARLSLARQVAKLALVFAALTTSEGASAHGIAGNRFFPGTLTFDDPAVADEAVVPNFSYLNHPAAGGDVTDNRINWSFTRLLTPTVGFVADTSWIHRNWGVSQRSGFDVTSVGLKWEVFRDNPHEALVSTSLTWGIGKSGAQGVDASAPNTIRPGIFLGKGFGDLPDSLSWLRPFGVTAAVVLEHPTGSVSTNLGIDTLSGQLVAMPTTNADILHWGFAVEFSTLYLTSRFNGGPAKGRTTESTRTAGRVCVRQFPWNEDDGNDEPGIVLCGGHVADSR
jgi:hypothetical protein